MKKGACFGVFSPSELGFSDTAFFYRHWLPAKIRNRASRTLKRATEGFRLRGHWGEEVSRYFNVSLEEAEKKALEKAGQWNKFLRKSEQDYRSYYLETDHECYRQPWYHRHDCWYEILSVSSPGARILDYGCGVGMMASWILKKRPDLKLTLADIPSQTFQFSRWRLGDKVQFLEIGPSDQAFPEAGPFDLIVCQEALNHIINPLDVIHYFYDHLKPGGYLFTDFTSKPGEAHLFESECQRRDVLVFLNSRLKPVRPLNDISHETGVYRKP